MMNDEVKTEEDARCIAVDYAARHDMSEHQSQTQPPAYSA